MEKATESLEIQTCLFVQVFDHDVILRKSPEAGVSTLHGHRREAEEHRELPLDSVLPSFVYLCVPLLLCGALNCLRRKAAEFVVAAVPRAPTNLESFHT